eukprot:TRINITY_DN719_c0_g1_i1.p1 TRINITY_DN719_c0_g1~~TRINITY_DN719_c0_g1_i1.p1  ORF type:complete len:551 (+),score=110.61 TRINITY_DN719_c0_g1_i1:123-1775(+)
MSQAVKLLVAGDVRGQLDVLFAKVKAVSGRHGFACLLCVGDFIGQPEEFETNIEKYRNGSVTVPLPVYFIAATLDNPALTGIADGGELAPNILYLGSAGCMGLHGLQVAYLSGLSPSKQQLDALDRSCFSRQVDVLMTCDWPQNFANELPVPPPLPLQSWGIESVAQAAHLAAPRYIFCGTHDVFYQRAPYITPPSASRRAAVATRLVTIAALGNTTQKWLYACGPTPAALLSEPELANAPGATASPFAPRLSAEEIEAEMARDAPPAYNAEQQQQQRKRDRDEQPFIRFQMDNEQKEALRQQERAERGGDGHGSERYDRDRGGHRDRGGRGGKRMRGPPAEVTQDCWFCLSSPHVQKEMHLIISVGEHCYVALAKGGLTTDHVLIVPIAHLGSSVDTPDDVLAEMYKYVVALRKTYADSNQVAVMFERALGQARSPQHMQFQVMPLPDTKLAQIRPAFQQAADFAEIAPEQSAKEAVGVHGHLLVDLPDGARLLAQGRPPVTFAREVCAAILQMPQRADWRACTLSREEEERAAEEFKARFKKHDFTLQ